MAIPFNHEVPSAPSTEPEQYSPTEFSSETALAPGVTQAADQTSAVITVVRDPAHNLGKHFRVKPDRSVAKTSSVSVSFGLAVQHHVPTHDDLAKLLEEVGNDPRAAIINARFGGIPIGERFAILSEREIEQRLGIPRSDRAQQKGVHLIQHEGQTIKAVGRFKENVSPSNWQLLDRDVDEHTPAHYATLTMREWLSALAAIIPGVDKTACVETPSTSSRVLRDGQPVGGGNGHLWVYVRDPADIERARAALIVRAAQADMTWLKPRYSRKDKDAVVGHGLTTLIDPSVWTVGRLVFDGRPTTDEGLTVEALSAVVHSGEHAELDTSAMVLPNPKDVRQIMRKAGIEMDIKLDGAGLRITANNLTLATEIETEDHGILTVREIIERGMSNKIRCQTPFRASASYAAFFNFGKDGIPFVHDVGTGITHWLNRLEADEVKLIRASAAVDQLLPKVEADSAAALEDEVVGPLATIKEAKPAEYQRKRNALKQANRHVSLTALDRAVKTRVEELSTAQTHHGYAKNILAHLIHEGWRPVGHQGQLYVLESATQLWLVHSTSALVRTVAELHDGMDNCQRSSDYRAVAEHAISLANDADYFSSAPTGVACPGGFYQIVGDAVTLVPLTADHRQRVMLEVTPAQKPTPTFDAFLHDTFKSEHDGEEAQQLSLVQEIAGAIMLGIMPRYQKAVLFYEPFGRAGKGTLERVLRALVPRAFVTAISPFKWSQDYHVATLAGARLNVVGELPENEAIPASSFKTVLGGDLITGRHPTHRPITFTNEAAHLFMSNHLITTKDQSEAFFSRWLIVDFPNSRLRTGLPLDPGLAERIVGNELPGIAYWALQGAMRLIHNGKFSASAAHDRLLAKWRRSTSSLDEFIYECCDLCPDYQVRRAGFYAEYSKWCGETGRKPFSKSRVKELLEHNLGMGVRLAEVNGYEIFRGLKLKPSNTHANPGEIVSIDDTDSTACLVPDKPTEGPASADPDIAF